MINFEDEGKKKVFNNVVIQIIISILLAILFTYIIINFLPFSDMLDEFKISFKTNTMEKIVKYYSFTLAIIIIPIYSVLYFGTYRLVNFAYKKIKEDREVE